MSSSPVQIFETHSVVYEQGLTDDPDSAELQSGSPSAWWRMPFSAKEVIISSIFLVLFCATMVVLFSHYPFYSCCFGQLSAAIRHWNFRNLDPSQPKELWGFSYLSALVATLTRLPDNLAIVAVSACMFVVANYLCCRLWGATVAAWLMVVNWWWLDVAAEGMTEPLFMALLLGSFIAVRKQQWVLAAVLASSATVVRPVGIFALVAIGIVLIRQAELRRLAITVAIALTTAALYSIPLMLIYGDPFANVRGYHTKDWSSELPVTIPLLPIIKGALIWLGKLKGEHGLRLMELTTLQILIAAWVLFGLTSTIRLAVDKRFWSYSRAFPAEAIFAGGYAIFLFCYNAPLWSWEHFPRFVIPLLPFVLLVLLDRLPRDRRIVWSVALLNIAISVLPKISAIHPMPR